MIDRVHSIFSKLLKIRFTQITEDTQSLIKTYKHVHLVKSKEIKLDTQEVSLYRRKNVNENPKSNLSVGIVYISAIEE